MRNVFVIGPDKKIKLILVYPMTTGRNFDEVLRVIDSLQLTAKHKVATPVNWKQGEDVIISGSVSNDQAKEIFGEWEAPEAVHPDRAATELRTRPTGAVILKQYYLGCLAHASYLIADEASGQAAVVDPQRDVEQYLDDAEAAGCRIDHVFLTHFHADFLAGPSRAARPRRRDASTWAPGQVRSIRSRRWRDGDGVAAWARCASPCSRRPATRPESISILVHDPAHGDGRARTRC